MPRTTTETDEPSDPAADRPPPRDDHAFLGGHKGRHRASSSATAVGMTAGALPYVPGRHHPAGRKHSAGYAPAPATLPAVVGRLTTHRFAGLPTPVPVGAPVGAALRARTEVHGHVPNPVHRGSGRGDWWQNR
ncbi:hypothetical protein [Streptomyces yangpuensis]|uniref:hypothetical protein n=1 Tax=Streptomyces yangpuensis TaxID=1648182 RepID=UPI003723A009